MDREFQLLKGRCSFLFGRNWWGWNGLIEERQPDYIPSEDERKAPYHPLLSVRRNPVESRYDHIPMLFGTSGKKMSRYLTPEEIRNCVEVQGLNDRHPDDITYFGSLVEPGEYTADDMLTVVHDPPLPGGSQRAGKIHKLMVPNLTKPRLSRRELEKLDRFCERHHL